MNIYVASSWRNVYHEEVVKTLESLGHSVYDFRNPPADTAFQWSQVSKNYQYWSPMDYVCALDHPIAKSGYASDKTAMQNADCCVLVMPAGRSASFEAGFMFGLGKKLYVFLLESMEPELMYREATFLLGWDQLRRAFRK